jgi:tetratricopeptide (TPR) repeat protein
MVRHPAHSLLVVACLIAAPVVSLAQHADHAESALPPAFNQPFPLHPEALGPLTRPISSAVPEVQAYFDQGMQLMYAFDTRGAARSFREAQQRDPECAMCHWGEAWSWGSYLNGQITPTTAPYAYAAIQKALALAPGRATPAERALIDAMAVRYVADFDDAQRRGLDEAYADAMRGVYERFPDDLEVATLYAESLFLLEPRRGSRDIDAPNVRRILQVLEQALARDIRHVGACHLLIHLTEATTDPGRAEPCAEFIGSAIPGASHINHMPSHTWNEVGRWGDSVRANIHAWISDQKAAVGEGFAIYPSHNLHMLAFAASMDGQGAIAMQAGRDYVKLTRDNMFLVFTLVRFERFDELLALADDSGARLGGVSLGVSAFGRGYARLRAGDSEAARAQLDEVKRLTRPGEMFRMHAAEHLLGTLAAILDGEIRRAAGDLDGAIGSFERAVELQDQLMYDEPEPLPFAARHWLGSALLDAKRYADAERVYREDLEAHPHNGWALFGLKAALEAQGKSSADVARDLDASWARADFWLRRSSP